jgi:hypothetical protein
MAFFMVFLLFFKILQPGRSKSEKQKKEECDGRFI